MSLGCLGRRIAIVGALLALAWTMPAAGEPIRVQPDDNPQQRIDAAPPRATIRLAAGDHRGPIVITRPGVTLRGEPGARLVGTGEGSVLTVDAEAVRLERFEIVGSGRNLANDDAGVLVLGDHAQLTDLRLRNNLHGIYLRGAKHARIEGNHVVGLAATEAAPDVAGAEAARRADGVHHAPPGTHALMGNGLHLWDADGAQVVGNRIHHVRDGIYVSHTHHAVFRDNQVHDSRYGIHYMYSSDNVVQANQLWRNVAGPALMFSRNLEVTDNVLRDHSGFRAYGLLLQNVDDSVIRGNTIRGNRVGMRLQNSSANRFRGNRVFGNIAGVTINSSSRDNTFTRNHFGLNMRQIELTGPAPPTQWASAGVGNRWHGSLPLDLTGDGISQWPHHEADLMAERREAFPPSQLLTGSLGIQALEWALTRAPVPGTRYITDPHPLTHKRERNRDDDRGS